MIKDCNFHLIELIKINKLNPFLLMRHNQGEGFFFFTDFFGAIFVFSFFY